MQLTAGSSAGLAHGRDRDHGPPNAGTPHGPGAGTRPRTSLVGSLLLATCFTWRRRRWWKGQEWDVRAVNVTLDLHSHCVPCAGAQTLHIPSHGSHLLSCSLFPSYHLPSILLTAAGQAFENLTLGHVTCLVCLAKLRVKSKLLTGPKGPQHPAGSSPPLARHIPAPRQRAVPPPSFHPPGPSARTPFLPRCHSRLIIPISTETSALWRALACPPSLYHVFLSP